MTGNEDAAVVPEPGGMQKGRLSSDGSIPARMAAFGCGCLLITVLFVACSPPAYRLEGEAPSGVSRVALLDSTAVRFVDSLWADGARRRADLEAARDAAVDSLAAKGEGLQAPLAEAGRRLRRARERYAAAFGATTRYLSFGGNPVFTEEDAAASTDDLLEAIGDRIHRGKAFSLETEKALRSHIKNGLQPLEAEVWRAAAAVRQVRGSGDQMEKEVERAKADFDAAVDALTAGLKNAVEEGIEEKVTEDTVPDSTGAFRFTKVGTGSYHVYAPGPLPRAWMEPVRIEGHTKVTLLPHRMRTVLVEDGG